MYGDWSFLCKFYGGKCLKGIVLSLWMSSSSATKLIKSMVTSNRNWKTKFFFISGFWFGHPIEVGRDPFAPYTGELGKLHPEGFYFFIFYLFYI